MAEGGKRIEAWRFGFGLPPANKFDPTDADLVAHYLLPRAVGFPNPYEHAVIDADPCSCPPWEFLRRHGHGDSDQAFFFGPPRETGPKKRASRGVAPGEDGAGGVWDGQKSEAFRLVLTRGGAGPGAAELAVRFKRHYLSYYHGAQRNKTSGWVMYDYQIIDPPHLSGTVLYRVKITDNNKKKQDKAKGRQRAGAGQLVVPPLDPDQPGPSNYYGAPDPDDQPPVSGDANDGDMGEAGGYYAGDGSNYMYEGYGYGFEHGDGSGGGDCFAAVDNDSYANGGGMGETDGYYAADGINYDLNEDSGSFLDHGGECYFDGEDNNSFEFPEGGSAG